jgi:hypothetical protein
LPKHPEIFVIGDMAACDDSNGHRLLGLAPVAMQQGAYIGRLIGKRLAGEAYQRFRYVDKGTLATIGRNQAVASFRNLRFGGFVAWVAWLFVHLLYLAGFQNRVLVAIQWAFHYFTYNRKARLIADPCPVDSIHSRKDEAEHPEEGAVRGFPQDPKPPATVAAIAAHEEGAAESLVRKSIRKIL